MLVQASRDGKLEVVLRLLYTNPFVEQQELRDALWEAVRCRQLAVLRSLLEFRVDPFSVPSPELSRPPPPLRSLPTSNYGGSGNNGALPATSPYWTPLVALAVNGSVERAECPRPGLIWLVAELLRCSGDRWVGITDTKSAAAEAPTLARRASPRAAPDCRQMAPTPWFGTAPSQKPASPAPEHGQQPHPQQKATQPHQHPCPQALPHSVVGYATSSSSSTTAGVVATSDGAAQSEILQALLKSGQSDTAEASRARDEQLSRLPREELANLEAVVEGLLRGVREHRQRRLEAQFESVRRRHAEENRIREALEDEQACVVCSDFPKSVLFMPCRHLCVCDTCASQLSACPICRSSIDDKVSCIRP